MATLDDVGDLLVDLGVVTDASLFLGIEPPENVDPCLTIYEAPGLSGDHTHDSPVPAIDYPMLRLICRSRDYQAARTLAGQVYDALWLNDLSINDDYYLNIWPMQAPFEMGPPDANNRRQVGMLARARHRN